MDKKVNYKEIIIQFLRGEFVKLALKKLASWLGMSLAGFKGWILQFVIKHFFDEIAEPIIRLAIRKGMLYYDQKQSELLLRKVDDAKKNNDKDKYRDTVGRL